MTTTGTTNTISSDALDDLNGLLGGARDGAVNYRNAAEHDGRVADLEAEVRRLGHEPEAGGRLFVKARRAVQEAKTAVSGHDDSATLSELEGGLDQAEKNYQLALRKPMPAPTRALLERQNQVLQQQHDQIVAFLRQDPGRETAHA